MGCVTSSRILYSRLVLVGIIIPISCDATPHNRAVFSRENRLCRPLPLSRPGSSSGSAASIRPSWRAFAHRAPRTCEFRDATLACLPSTGAAASNFFANYSSRRVVHFSKLRLRVEYICTYMYVYVRMYEYMCTRYSRTFRAPLI